MEINVKKRLYLKYVLFFLWYLFAFYPVLKSGYMYDDLINYTIKGACINLDRTTWSITKEILLSWFLGTGRCFFFGFYAYFLFYFVNLHVYKFLIVVITFLNGMLISAIIGKVLESDRAKSLVLLCFPLLVSLDCSYFNAMYGFHMLLQVCFLWCVLGIYFFVLYEEKRNIYYQVLSCIFWCLSLGTYEVAYIFCVVFFVCCLHYQRNFWRGILHIIPQAIVEIFWVLLNVYARLNASGEYVGTKFSFGSEVFGALLRQLSGSMTIGNVITLKELAINYDVILMCRQYAGRYILFISVFIISYVILSKYNVKEYKNINYISAFLIGLAITVLPACLIAVSSRYQQEVTWYHGYLPAYISSWGVTIVFIVLLLIGLHIKNRIYKRLFEVIIISVLLTSGTVNQIIGDITVTRANAGRHGVNEFVADAVNTGIIDELPEDVYFIDGTGCWGVETGNHYAYLLSRKVLGTSWDALYGYQEDGTFYVTDLFHEIQRDGFWYSTFETGRYNVVGKCTDIFLDYAPDGTVVRKMMADNFQVYIPNNRLVEMIEYTDERGQVHSVKLSNEKFLQESSKGRRYGFKLDDAIDLNTINIIEESGTTLIALEDGEIYEFDISKIDNSEKWEDPRYVFVNAWAEKYNINVSTDIKISMANSMRNLDVGTYTILYSWSVTDPTVLVTTDNEYIDYLYNSLLNRREGDGERKGWVTAMQNGLSREDAFYSFLNSEEFRNNMLD